MSVRYVCTRCKIEKTKYNFYRRRRSPDTVRDGRQCRCISCNLNLPKEEEERKRELNRKSNDKLKYEVFMHYSEDLMICNCCGETTIKFLTLDHINGNGAQHRKEVGSARQVYRDLRKNNYPEGYQILCYNCNCGRAKNNGVCPHEEI